MRESTTSRGEKRARILEAATRIFASKGFACSTVAEVAREAGVADGTIYLYFRNKDDLLIRLVEERISLLIERMSRALEEARSPLEKVATFIRSHLRMVEASPELAQVLIVEPRQSENLLVEHLAPALRSYLGLLGEILEEGIADGSIDPGLDSRAMRHALFGALDEVAYSWLRREKRFDLQANAAQLAELFVRGLAAPQPNEPRERKEP